MANVNPAEFDGDAAAPQLRGAALARAKPGWALAVRCLPLSSDGELPRDVMNG